MPDGEMRRPPQLWEQRLSRLTSVLGVGLSSSDTTSIVAPEPPPGTGGGTEPAPVLPTPFADGDLLLLYTDGLVERRGESIDGGIRRLAAMASALAEVHSLDVLVDRLVGGMLGGAVDDDVCVLVARHR